MIIQPNEDGWSFSGTLESNQLCLVYKDGEIIYYGKKEISTTETLFVGTFEECEAEIQRVGLPVLYKIVYNKPYILYFGRKIDREVLYFDHKINCETCDGYGFIGTKEECEAEMERLDVLWDAEEAEANYKLVYNNNIIIYFGPNDNNSYEGTEFLGSKLDCEVQITRLSLHWHSEIVEDIQSS
jgi:hypothetical protein